MEPDLIEEYLKDPNVLSHPLLPVFLQAIDQALYGKGERHGGAKTPFCVQPWVHYYKMHGRGFLTGQAAKKLEEAVNKETDEEFLKEVLGSMVYSGMAIIKTRENLKKNSAD